MTLKYQIILIDDTLYLTISILNFKIFLKKSALFCKKICSIQEIFVTLRALIVKAYEIFNNKIHILVLQ